MDLLNQGKQREESNASSINWIQLTDNKCQFSIEVVIVTHIMGFNKY